MGTGEIREAVSNTLREILEAIKDTIEQSPPELIGDVVEDGIFLTGGGALVKGLPQLIAKETKVPVVVAEDPLTSVVRGTIKILEDQRMREKMQFAGAVK